MRWALISVPRAGNSEPEQHAEEVNGLIETYGLSDVGCVRELNEDSFCIHGFDEENDVGFCVLADGMGGNARV